MRGKENVRKRKNKKKRNKKEKVEVGRMKIRDKIR